MSQLSLHLFGPPRVEMDDRRVSTDRRKAVALLAYLAVTRQSHTREALAALLWPEYDQSRAYAYLRRTLWEINQVIGEGWVQIDRETIAIDLTADVQLDVARFQKLVAESRSADRACAAQRPLLQEAAELYRDHFLAGFSLKDAPGFDEWVFFQAENLQRDLAYALDTLVRCQLEAGEAETAIPIARRRVSLDTLSEAAHRQLMRAYERAGQHSAALRQYQECARILQEEIGAHPDPETIALYERIKSGAEQSRPTPATQRVPTVAQRHNLPPAAASFVGRAAELAQVAELLSNPDCRLLTLVGPGGVGKTRLALQAAQAQLPAFRDGVFFVPLAPIDDAAAVVSAIASAVGFSFFNQTAVDTQAVQTRQLLNYLREKHMLLIMDNFEQLLPATSLLIDILTTAPQVKLLATSRERLNVQDEWVLTIGGMRVPLQGASDDLEAYSAIKLFVQNARKAGVGFTLTEAERPHVVHICRMVDGLPLAVELAAAWTKTLTCREIAQEIERSLDFLTTPLRDVPARHHSLRAVFEYSWTLLSPIEQETYRRLSVFRGGCDRVAAQIVARATLPVLTALVDKSLLYHRENGRYEQHEVLRQYAAEKLDEAMDDRAQTLDRHSAFFAEFVAIRDEKLHGHTQQQALEELGTEMDNIRAGWYRTIGQHDAARVNRYIDGLAWFLEYRVRYQEATELFGQGIAVFEQKLELRAEDTVAIGRLLIWQGHFYYRLGFNATEGTALLRNGLTRLQPFADDRRDEFATARLLNLFWDAVAGRAERELLMHENLASYQAQNNRWGISQMLMVFAVDAEYQGRPGESIRRHQEALRMQREIGDSIGTAQTLNHLGEALHHIGQYAEALRCYQEALSLARQMDARWAASQSLDFTGYVARRMGDFVTAREQHEASLALSREIGDRLGVAGSLDNLGLVAYDTGDYVEAARFFEEGLVIRREARWDWTIAISLTHLASVALARGDEARADQLLQESLSLWEDWPYTFIQVAELRRRRGDMPRAQEYLQRALKIGQERSETPLVLECLTHIAGLSALAEDATEAAEILAFVLGQSASDYATRTKANRLLREVSARLSAERLSEAKARGQSTTLEAILAAIQR